MVAEPFQLPKDLAGFLQITDGLAVRWKAESLQTEITVGAFDLNCLNRIERMEDVDSLSPRDSSTFSPMQLWLARRRVDLPYPGIATSSYSLQCRSVSLRSFRFSTPTAVVCRTLDL